MTDSMDKLVTEACLMDKLVEEAWLEHGCFGWNLTVRELNNYSFSPGESSGDLVYISPEGHEMTRHMCDRILDTWPTFSHAFRIGFEYGQKSKD